MLRKLEIMKKEFDSIELIDRNIAWQENIKENKYTALRDTSSIFVIFDHGVFQHLHPNHYKCIL